MGQLGYNLTVIKPDGTKRHYKMTGAKLVKLVKACEETFKESPASFEPDRVMMAVDAGIKG